MNGRCWQKICLMSINRIKILNSCRLVCNYSGFNLAGSFRPEAYIQRFQTSALSALANSARQQKPSYYHKRYDACHGSEHMPVQPVRPALALVPCVFPWPGSVPGSLLFLSFLYRDIPWYLFYGTAHRFHPVT